MIIRFSVIVVLNQLEEKKNVNLVFIKMVQLLVPYVKVYLPVNKKLMNYVECWLQWPTKLRMPFNDNSDHDIKGGRKAIETYVTQMIKNGRKG